MISTLLTQQGGEYLLRIGARPPRAPLYANENLDSADGWTGDERTEAEIDTMIERVVQLVEEVGGKVLLAFEILFRSGIDLIFRLVSYFALGILTPELLFCYDYLRPTCLSHQRYDVRWLAMLIVASQPY